jgi:hypothetical protein
MHIVIPSDVEEPDWENDKLVPRASTSPAAAGPARDDN